MHNKRYGEEMKKVLWLSANKFGLELLKECITIGIKVEGIITLKDSSKTIMYDGIGQERWNETGKKYDIPVYYIDNINNETELIKQIAADVIIMCGWRQIISNEVIALPKKGIIGFHPTLLPKGRGPAPIINTIMKGEKESGITMFYVADGLDNGDIIGQEKFSIDKNDHASEVYEKAIDAAKKLIRINMPLIVEDKEQRTAQISADATIFDKPRLAGNEIDIEKDDIDTMFRKIKALSKPYNGAYIIKDGKKLIIWRAELAD
jgi:methionyl-tRNA formyltransferase